MFGIRLFVIVFSILFVVFQDVQAEGSVPWVHVSALANFELTESYSPGIDLNIIFQNTWGLKFSTLPNVRFGAVSEVDLQTNRIALINASGEFRSTMILRTIDYRSFGSSDSHPFNFLTAYTAVGYSEVAIQVDKRSFIANSSLLNQVTQSEQINTPIYAAAFGLYGGERFFVIDAHILYMRGTINLDGFLEKSMDFDHWLIIFGFGVGF